MDTSYDDNKSQEKEGANITESDEDPKSISFIRHVLRAWGVHIVYVCSKRIDHLRRPRQEQPKVAVFHSKWLFFLESLIHIVPVGVCLGLVLLNLIGFFVGEELAGPVGYETWKLIGLQIAAKLTELVIVASLTAFIFALVRHELTSLRGIPFAALSAGLEFGSLSCLWSSGFWALLVSPALSIKRKILFVTTLVVSAGLALLVGPSTALLLQSRMDSWPAGGTAVWLNTTMDKVFPGVLNESLVLDPDYDPSQGWETIAEFLPALRYNDHPSEVPGHRAWIPSGGIAFTIEDTVVQPKFLLRPTAADETYTSTWMVTPYAGISRAMTAASALWLTAAGRAYEEGERRFFNYLDMTYSLVTLAPYVMTRCNATMYSLSHQPCVKFPLITPAGPEDVLETCDNPTIERWLKQDLTNNSQPSIHWIDGNYDGSNDLNLTLPGGFSAGALITLPATEPGHQHVIGCTSMVQFNPMTVYKGRFTANPTTIDNYLAPDASLVPVPITSAIQKSWLERLNPKITSLHSNVFSQLLQSAGLWDNGRAPAISHTNRFEAVLMFMLGNGLARLDPHAAPQGSVKDFVNGTETGHWWRNLMPSGTFGQGGNGYDIAPTEADQYLQARMDAYAEGYGYATTVGSDSSGTILAIVLVLVYVLFASLLFVISVWRGSFTSTSWASTAELTTLALGSEYLDESYDCTSAGVDTMGPLKQSVRVLPRNGRLQLVVTGGNADDRSLLLANEAY